MDSVRELAVVFCAVSVLSGAIGILTGGAMEKSAGYILSLIFLASVITALAGADFNLEIKVEQSAAASTKNEEAMSEYQAEYICAALLREKNIAFEKITATATKTEDGSIIINEIAIKGTDGGEEAVKAVRDCGICEKVILE